MSCKCSYGCAKRQLQERDRKWCDVHFTRCRERFDTLFFFFCLRCRWWAIAPVTLASEVSVSEVAAFRRFVVVVDVAFACFCLPGRVPAPLWKGEAWGCTTRERVSSKMLRLKTEKKNPASLCTLQVCRVEEKMWFHEASPSFIIIRHHLQFLLSSQWHGCCFSTSQYTL